MRVAGVDETARDGAGPIGVIVGTGTNMAGFFPFGAIAKLGPSPGWRTDEMMAAVGRLLRRG